MQSFDRVISDHELGSFELTRMLLSRGAERIVQFGIAHSEHYWVKARRRGYERAMRDAGLEPLPVVRFHERLEASVDTADEFALGVRMVAGHLVEHMTRSPRVDAFLLDTDYVSFYLNASIRLFGLQPGKDVLVAGYDDYWHTSPLRRWESTTPIATVDKRPYEVGMDLMRLLTQRRNGELSDDAQLLVRQPRIIITDGFASVPA